MGAVSAFNNYAITPCAHAKAPTGHDLGVGYRLGRTLYDRSSWGNVVRYDVVARQE